jgi:hypothetical protein
MKNIYKYLIVFLCIISLKSCDYLEAEEYLHEVKTAEDYWQKKIDIKLMWAGCYGGMPDFSSFDDGWYFIGASDEAQPGVDWTKSYKFAKGNYTSRNIPRNYWHHFYTGIRVCNTFIEKTQKPNSVDTTDFLQGELEGFIADAKFLKAYYYSQLLEIYGPFVIVDKRVDFTNKNYPIKREPIDVCVDYIVNLIDDVIDDLPKTFEEQHPDYKGRPTKGAAMACKARVLLYAASPLLNGNPRYISFKNSKDELLIPDSYDIEKWKKAAKAYKDIIDLGLYDIYTVDSSDITIDLGTFNGNTNRWPNGPAGIDPYLSYKNLFTGEDIYNKEVIWQINSNDITYRMQALGWPRTFQSVKRDHVFRTNATQKIVDAYCMINGETIENSALYNDVSGTNAGDGKYITGTANGSPIRTKTASVPIPTRCLNREPRFYASIGFHGRGSRNHQGNYEYIEFAKTGNNSFNPSNWTGVLSGYSIVKWIKDFDDINLGSSTNYKPFHIYRFAEICLSYAEALNESDPGNSDILKYINMVRFRGGMPAYTEKDQAKVREFIKRERFVEFAFEGKRYFDSKRWLEADKVDIDKFGNYKGMLGEYKGCDYKLKTDEGYFNRGVIDYFNFRQKNYLYPLPYSQVNNEWGVTVQNPGW